MTEAELRLQMAAYGKSLFERGYTCGSSGNMSVCVDDGLLVTPTNCCLGRIDPARITKVDHGGRLLSGDRPTKELFLHQAVYRSRPSEQAVIHLHSVHAVAVSCLADVDPDDALPPLTPYYIMRVGRLPLVPYHAPGDPHLADEVQHVARRAHCMLLANHGPVVAGHSLDQAVSAMEELEETARLFWMLRGQTTRLLSPGQVHELRERFPH